MIKGVGQGVGRDIGRSAGRNEGDGERSKDFLFAGLRNANASIDDNAEAVAGTSLTASLSRGDGRGDGRNDGDTDGSDDGRCDGARDGRDDGPRDGREDGAKVCANDAGGEELTQRTPSVGILEPVISVLLLARMDASPVGLALVFARMEKRRKQPSRFREPFASPISLSDLFIGRFS